jgi:acyl-homoserine lactone acylase PvdQ
MMRRLAATVVIVAAALTAPSVASADRAYNILPPGEFGGIPTTQSSKDQLPLYDALTPKLGNVTGDDLRRLFKPELLEPSGPTRIERTPRRGLTIRRDSFGVPHIYGRTRGDVFYGQGWVTAEDRALLLALGRGPGRAAIADVPGLNAFAVVTSGRSFTPSAQAEALVTSEQRQLVRAFGARGRQILRDIDAFAAGVNAFFATTSSPPARWTRNDTIAAFAFVGSIFGNGGGAEASNDSLLASLRERLGVARGSRAWLDLMEANDPEAPTTIAKRFPFGRVSGGPTKGSPLIDRGSLNLAADPTKPPEASNFLVVGDSRSAPRASLAVMGPQLGYFYPEIVLEADLHGPGIRARGAVAPGSPYILIGRTRDYAWSLTTAQNDNTDLFLEQLCRDDRHYVYRGSCRPMTRFDAGVLGAGGGQPAKQLVYDMTVHGPVVGTATVGGRPFAISKARSTYGQEALSLGALHDMTAGRGRTVAGFYRSANQFGYTFNWAYSSRRHVAYFSSGRIPRDEPGVNELLPRLGTGRYDWKGFLPLRRHPHAVDPPGGLLLNWNNKPAPGWMQGDNVHTYGSVHRVELFKGFPRRTRLEDVASIMNRAATQDLRTVELWPVIRAVLGSSPAPDVRTAQAVALVDAWRRNGASRIDRDLDGKIDDPGAAVMDTAFVPIADAVMRPVLGPVTEELMRLQAPDEPPYRSGGNGSSFGGGWYGYIDKDLRTALGRRVRGRFNVRYCGTGSLSACRASIWSALASATALLAASQGSDPAAWRSDATLDRIEFSPGLIPDTMRWTNRPTFQQVLELSRP